MDIQELRADLILGKIFKSLQLANYLGGSSHSLSTLIPFSLLTILAIVIVLIARRILVIRHYLKQEAVLLELTPPSVTEKNAYTTDQLFSIIHSIGSQRSFKDRILGYISIFSLEIASTRSQGIRYLVRTSPKQLNTLRKSLVSYLPHLRVRVVDEYLSVDLSVKKLFYKVLEFKLSKHYAFSLKRQSELEMHDPIAYLTGQMTKLLPDELISLHSVTKLSDLF